MPHTARAVIVAAAVADTCPNQLDQQLSVITFATTASKNYVKRNMISIHAPVDTQ